MKLKIKPRVSPLPYEIEVELLDFLEMNPEKLARVLALTDILMGKVSNILYKAEVEESVRRGKPKTTS